MSIYIVVIYLFKEGAFFLNFSKVSQGFIQIK